LGQTLKSSSANVVPKEIVDAARQLVTILRAKSVRIWRYVDSQNALFGFWAEPPLPREEDGPALAFDDFVAFLRDPTTLGEYSSEPVSDLSDHVAADSTRRHLLWDVPEYRYLPKETREHYIEAILVLDPKAREQTADDLVAVVCIDAPFKNYQDLPPSGDGCHSKADVHELLDGIRAELRSYSLVHFREGFRAAEPYLRGPNDAKAAPTDDTVFLRDAFGKLVLAMDSTDEQVSVYLRAVTREEDPVELIDGSGQFFSVLKAVEARLRRVRPAEIPSNLFSFHAQRELEKSQGMTPLLFPGSGDSETYNQYKNLFLTSRVSLKVNPSDVPVSDLLHQDSSRLADLSGSIVNRGSFGVFPIRCMTDTPLKGQLLALLCVAVPEKRNFFTWHRRLVLERFCRMVARRHDMRLSPVLSRVSQRAHDQLVASPRVLVKLLSAAGPLVQCRAADVDGRSSPAFVVSVDLRKSTELMLKIVPESSGAYASILMRMCERMRDAMKEEFAIFDKFTGDGVLAFFPSFFSGRRRDVAYRAIAAAERCHKLFDEFYEDFWPHLLSVPIPGNAEEAVPDAVGLGIGIDYGVVRLVNVGDELTIVGAPVVYACRMSGSAHACSTLLNQRAFDVVKADGLLDYLKWTQEAVRIKHEGSRSVAYRVRLKSRQSSPTEEWRLPTLDDQETWRAKYPTRFAQP
jgi:class 3 adenylate cyclase